MRIDEFISFGLEINMSIRAVEVSLYKHSGLTDLLRSTETDTGSSQDTARAGPFEVDGPLNASHPALFRTPRRKDLRSQPTIDSLSVARLLLPKPINGLACPA